MKEQTYYADKPIDSFEDDILGRAEFSKQLGGAIFNYRGEDSLVIGIYGKWGIGKTSVVNMAMQELSALSAQHGKSLLQIKFSPWNYSDGDNLLSLFFASLNKAIKKDDKISSGEELSKNVDRYVDALDAFSVIPQFGIIAKLVKLPLEWHSEKLKERADLDNIKNDIAKYLRKIRQRIVVVIDDIDRLTDANQYSMQRIA